PGTWKRHRSREWGCPPGRGPPRQRRNPGLRRVRARGFAMFGCGGFDLTGVRRVLGEGRTADAAEYECRVAAQNYVRRRPDTGPLADWTFRPVLPPDLVA